MLTFSQMFAGWCMIIAGFVCAKRAWSCSKNAAFKKHVPIYITCALVAIGTGAYVVINLIAGGEKL